MAKLSSSTFDATPYFADVLGDPNVDAASSDAAFLAAMLDVEAAVARSAADVGLIPAAHAQLIGAVCRPELIDPVDLARGWATDATPVVALVTRLRSLVPEDVSSSVHWPATSQDVLDTAMVLVARRSSPPLLARVGDVTTSLASLAADHRDTPQAGRTLLQQAARTTFGALCAARLVGIDEAARGYQRVVTHRLAAQLGGAVGDLGAAGERGPALLDAFAAAIDLPSPVLPWHTTRGRVAELAAAAGVLGGELSALAQDLVLLGSSEVGEVSPAAPGKSSSVAHKENSSSAVLAVACAHRLPGLVATVLAGMPQELQRSAGRWQAEWSAVRDTVRLLGGTARHTAAAVDGLVVHPERMAEHLVGLAPGAGAGGFVDRALAAHRRRG